MPLCDGGVPRSQGLGGRRQGEQASDALGVWWVSGVCGE